MVKEVKTLKGYLTIVVKVLSFHVGGRGEEWASYFTIWHIISTYVITRIMWWMAWNIDFGWVNSKKYDKNYVTTIVQLQLQNMFSTFLKWIWIFHVKNLECFYIHIAFTKFCSLQI
jgi:hypothetical protein